MFFFSSLSFLSLSLFQLLSNPQKTNENKKGQRRLCRRESDHARLRHRDARRRRRLRQGPRPRGRRRRHFGAADRALDRAGYGRGLQHHGREGHDPCRGERGLAGGVVAGRPSRQRHLRRGEERFFWNLFFSFFFAGSNWFRQNAPFFLRILILIIAFAFLLYKKTKQKRKKKNIENRSSTRRTRASFTSPSSRLASPLLSRTRSSPTAQPAPAGARRPHRRPPRRLPRPARAGGPSRPLARGRCGVEEEKAGKKKKREKKLTEKASAARRSVSLSFRSFVCFLFQRGRARAFSPSLWRQQLLLFI